MPHPPDDGLSLTRPPVNGNGTTTVVERTGPGGAGAGRAGGGRAGAGPGGTGHPPRPPGPSTRPALIVVGIALLVLVLGALGAVLTGTTKPTPTPSSLRTAPGARFTAVPGRAALGPIVTGGQPPDDILDVVALPRGAEVVPGSGTDNGIGLYDHSLSLRIAASEQSVINFFRAELPFLKWQKISQGPARDPSDYQIVVQHPSSDGYEWEMGVTLDPTTFPAGATSAAESTRFTLRLFAITDDD